MFDIREMPAVVSADVLNLLAEVETATIGHFLHMSFVHRAVQSITPGKRIIGTAVTVRIPHADSTALHYLSKLVRPGDVVLVDRCGDDVHACWGGGVTAAMKHRGVLGAIVDGPGTDFAEVRSFDFPLWCRGGAPVTTKILGLEGAINVPASIGGLPVMPGDVVLADDSGVVVLAPERVAAVAERAVRLQERQANNFKRIENGEFLSDISGATSHVDDPAKRLTR